MGPMRAAFFALVFVNILYFAWAHWIDVAPPPPVNATVARLPHLKLIDELPPAERDAVNAAAQAAQTDPAPCLSVGPFADLDNSARATALLRAKGFDPRQRAETGQTSEGYGVYVNGMKDQAEADRALVALEHSGITDARVMPESADAERRLSLGLYTERGRAERRAEAVRQAGLNAEVVERKLSSPLYWVDLSPPVGMNSVPIQDLLAHGVSSHIAVQPCPARPAGGSAGPGAVPGAPSVPASTTANAPSAQADAGRKLR